MINIVFEDKEFEKKVREMRMRMRSRMNGVAAEQMRNGMLEYDENYGVALPDIKLLAEQFELNDNECQELWKLNIRELKIIAAIKISYVRNADFSLWIEHINTPEMAEMCAFFALWRIDEIDAFAAQFLESKHTFATTAGYLAISRALLKGREIDTSTQEKILRSIDCHATESIPQYETNAMLNALRAIGRTSEMSMERASEIANKYGWQIDF
ncbi:MAG: DNA alkylation repair protein [Bacteroidales bacterium]|nr:DNA alkylation repair protein [Bacteroidales bacterium]